MKKDLSDTNVVHAQIIESTLLYHSRVYYNSFNKNDLEDIVSEAKVKLLLYMPKLQSEKHAYNWARFFCKRHLINAMRDFCNKNKKHNFVRVEEDSDLMEKTACAKAFSDANYSIAEEWAQLRLDQDTKEVRKILENYHLPKDKLGKMIGISRRQVLNRVKKLRQKVKEDLNGEVVTI